jgi:hypothetical protein
MLVSSYLDACGPPTPHRLASLDLRLQLRAIDLAYAYDDN